MTWARRSAVLARWVLAWFVLALGVANAAPMLQPLPTQIVCGADGQIRLVVDADASGIAAGHAHALHCPMCLLGPGAAPVCATRGGVSPAPAVTVVQVDRRAAVVPRSSSLPPLPARGPPERLIPRRQQAPFHIDIARVAPHCQYGFAQAIGAPINFSVNAGVSDIGSL